MNADGSIGTTTFTFSVTDLLPVLTESNMAVTAAMNFRASNSGTFADYDDAVTITASSGSVTQTTGINGTWTWTSPGGETNPYTVTITATNADNSISTITFNVSFIDVAFAVDADSGAVSAPENASASNTGRFVTYDEAMTITASTGTVTRSSGTSGTWSWSGTGNANNPPYTVTITLTNSDSTTVTTSFSVSFTDLAPTVTENSAAVSAPQATYATNAGTFADYDDAVTITASKSGGVGTFSQTVTQTSGTNGTWSWSGTDNTAETVTVTITATNADGSTATTTFAATFSQPVTLTWTGVVDNKWSTLNGTNSNWSGGSAGHYTPLSGDTLIFPAGAANQTSYNDTAAGTSYVSITFTTGTGGADAYVITGNSVTLTNATPVSDTSTVAGHTNSLGLNITLPATTALSETQATSTLVLSGILSGAGTAVNFTGNTGTVSLTGANNGVTGAVTFAAGTVSLGSNSALGTGNVIFAGRYHYILDQRVAQQHGVRHWCGLHHCGQQ